jgi:purine-binding chemotaxis protein CheW
MLATQSRFDWDRIKQQLAQSQASLDDATCNSSQRLSEVFRRRAEQLARHNRRDSERGNGCRTIVFRLSGERYGIGLSHVVQVFPNVTCARVPGAAAHLMGVAGLRGEVRSVIDLRYVLNLAVTSDAKGHVLLVKAGSNEIGIWVESVEEVEHVEWERCDTAREQLQADLGPFLLGVTGEDTILLDIDAVVDAVTPRREPPDGPVGEQSTANFTA